MHRNRFSCLGGLRLGRLFSYVPLYSSLYSRSAFKCVEPLLELASGVFLTLLHRKNIDGLLQLLDGFVEILRIDEPLAGLQNAVKKRGGRRRVENQVQADEVEIGNIVRSILLRQLAETTGGNAHLGSSVEVSLHNLAGFRRKNQCLSIEILLIVLNVVQKWILSSVFNRNEVLYV